MFTEHGVHEGPCEGRQGEDAWVQTVKGFTAWIGVLQGQQSDHYIFNLTANPAVEKLHIPFTHVLVSVLNLLSVCMLELFGYLMFLRFAFGPVTIFWVSIGARIPCSEMV